MGLHLWGIPSDWLTRKQVLKGLWDHQKQLSGPESSGQICSTGTAARALPNLHLGACSYHRARASSYHVGSKGRATAEIYVKGQASRFRDRFQIRSGLRAQRHYPDREGGSPALKGSPHFAAVQTGWAATFRAVYSNTMKQFLINV